MGASGRDLGPGTRGPLLLDCHGYTDHDGGHTTFTDFPLTRVPVRDVDDKKRGWVAMMWWDDGMGWGGWTAMTLVMLAFWALVILGLIAADEFRVRQETLRTHD